jgi:threonyl-tRNA synthetase
LDLSILRRTAAEIAAAAVYEIYPDVELWGGGETSTGFFYDFYFPHPIHQDRIIEGMRQIIRERRPIRTLEMVPLSARELLKKEGHMARADEVEEGLVEVIQIGSFYDLCPGPHLKNTAEVAAFKITVEPLPDKGLRVNGWCHTSKEELRQFLKKLESYVEHPLLGEKRGLWKGGIWLPHGLKLRQELIQFLKEQWFEGALEVESPWESDRTAKHRSLSKPKIAESWTLPEAGVQVSFFDKPESEMISSLQSIGKTLTILGFDHSTVPCGRGVDFLIEDDLGRKWPVVQLKRTSKEGAPSVEFHFTVAVERMLALLLEKNLQMVER